MCLRGLHYKKASNFVGRSGSVDQSLKTICKRNADGISAEVAGR